MHINSRSELIIKSVVRAPGFREFECRSNRRTAVVQTWMGRIFLFDGRSLNNTTKISIFNGRCTAENLKPFGSGTRELFIFLIR